MHSLNIPATAPAQAVDATCLDEIKALLLSAVDAQEPPGGLRTDEVLFGPDSRMDLDSLDGLQLSVAIQKRYGIRMADSKDLRRALASLEVLAHYIATHRK